MAWTELDNIADRIGDVDHKMPQAQIDGVPYISTKDFSSGNAIDFSAAKIISKEDFARLCQKIAPERNDILLSRYGTVGEVRTVNTDIPFQASYSIAIIKVQTASYSSDYVARALKTPFLQEQIRSHIRASSQPDVGLASIRSLMIPFPPYSEQCRIVAELDRRTSLLDQLEAVLDTNLKRIEGLRQSILRKAFSGRLT